MLEDLSDSTEEMLRSQFGHIPELSLSHYKMTAYDPEQGTLRFEGGFSKTPDYFVDYVLIDPQKKLVARRKQEYAGYGENFHLGEVSVEFRFRESNRIVKYSLNYEYMNKNHPPYSAEIGVYHDPNIGELPVELASVEYQRRGIESVYLALGDVDSLVDYHRKEREKPPHPIFARVPWTPPIRPSKPGVQFVIEEKDNLPVITLQDAFDYEDIEQIEIGKIISPEELAPYRFLVTEQDQRSEYERTCGACGENWKLFVSHMNLDELDKKIKGEWTTLHQAFPSDLAIKEGIKPCPSDIKPEN